MTAIEFPLAELELTRSGRWKSLYALRAVVPAIAVVALLIMSGLRSEPEDVGRFLVGLSQFFQYALVLIAAPLLTAGLVAREKEEGTLELLALADFRGRDIFLAKYLSAFLQIELLLLTTLPIMALAALLGGIDVPALALQVFLLSVCAAAVCAIGLLSSTIAQRPGTAFMVTLAVLGAWFLLGAAAAVLPFFGLGGRAARALKVFNILAVAMATDAPGFSTSNWLSSVLFSIIVLSGAAVATVYLLPRQIRRTPAAVRRGRRVLRAKRNTPPMPRKALARLAGAAGGQTGLMRLGTLARIGIAILLLVLLPMMFCFGGILIAALLIYETASAMASARKTGALEELLITPSNDRELGRAFVKAHLRRCAIFLPVLVLTSLFSSGASLYGPFSITQVGNLLGADLRTPWLIAVALVFLVLTVAGLLAQYFYYVSLACYMSSRYGSPVRQTILGVLAHLGIVIGLAVLISIGSVVFMAVTAGGAFLFNVQPVAPLATGIVVSSVSIGFHLLVGWCFLDAFADRLRAVPARYSPRWTDVLHGIGTNKEVWGEIGSRPKESG